MEISKRTLHRDGCFSLGAGCVWLTRSWVQNVGYRSRNADGHSKSGIICGAPLPAFLFLFVLFCLPTLEALPSWEFFPNPRDGLKKASHHQLTSRCSGNQEKTSNYLMVLLWTAAEQRKKRVWPTKRGFFRKSKNRWSKGGATAQPFLLTWTLCLLFPISPPRNDT